MTPTLYPQGQDLVAIVNRARAERDAAMARAVRDFARWVARQSTGLIQRKRPVSA